MAMYFKDEEETLKPFSELSVGRFKGRLIN